MNFIPVTPEEFPNKRESRRGRVSYPILKSFMETGMHLAKLDLTGIQQTPTGLWSALKAYIESHKLPLQVFLRRKEIFLMRTDTDQGESVLHVPPPVPVEITPDEVAKRFAEEVGKTTK